MNKSTKTLLLGVAVGAVGTYALIHVGVIKVLATSSGNTPRYAQPVPVQPRTWSGTPTVTY